MNLFTGCVERKLTNGLRWCHEPPEWFFDNDEVLTLTPGAKTDCFRPYQKSPMDNAPILYKDIAGDFTIATHITAQLTDFADAGGLIIRSHPSLWAKVCMERNHLGQTSVVSVVTNPSSDDALGELLSQSECHLRITRKGNYLGMHYSLDGQTWRVVRCFGMEVPESVIVGVLAQAPFGSGCCVRFHGLYFQRETVDDFRSGK